VRSLSRVAILVFSALAVSPAFAAQFYSVVPVAGANSNSYAINASGDVTGVFRTAGGQDHAFIYTQDNGFLDLGTLAGGNSVGRDINNSRNVVGQSDGRAFRYSAGNGMVGLSNNSSDARGLNNTSNQAIGTIQTVHDVTTIWDALNGPTSIFASENTQGYAINDAGERVGRVDGTTGYYSGGGDNVTYTDLGLFLPTDIQDTNHLVSGSENGIATLYNPISGGSFLPLGKLNPTDTLSDALSLNNLNQVQVVGLSEGTGGFLWTQADGMKNLSTLLAPGSEQWSVISANGINDNGWITGQALFNGEQFAVIMTPVPEPGSLVLLIGGAALLAAAFSVRSRHASVFRCVI